MLLKGKKSVLPLSIGYSLFSDTFLGSRIKSLFSRQVGVAGYMLQPCEDFLVSEHCQKYLYALRWGGIFSMWTTITGHRHETHQLCTPQYFTCGVGPLLSLPCLCQFHIIHFCLQSTLRQQQSLPWQQQCWVDLFQVTKSEKTHNKYIHPNKNAFRAT